MANADKPAAAGPPPETAVTPTPPSPAAAPGAVAPAERRARRPLTPERLAQDIRRLDRVLATLVLPLAFLLASFAIHNSDFWMHLATGRALVQGSYDVFAGNDPFSSTTAGTHWINHAWLFDGAVYGLYLLAGGPGLVVFKGVLVVALAVVLFQIRRPGQSLWAPVVCVGLALLALSPRLLFQPMVLSMLFLGITLALLMRADEPGSRSSRRVWLLVPLFALWANLDNWFLLGPLTVALFLLGGWLKQLAFSKDGWDGKRAKGLALVLVVSLAACLLNPNGLRVFALPPELAYLVVHNPEAPPSEWTAAGTTLRALTSVDPTAYQVFSPLSKNYWDRPEIGLNVAGLTYFVLLGLGLLSFLLVGLAGRTAPATRLGPRLLIWLVFAGLSLGMSRLIPFFAVVAGPFTALNLQDFARQRFGGQVRTQGPWGLWSLGGRLLTGVGCLGLLFLAWPGWLHGRPDDPRTSHRVAWRLYEDPSLRQATERLRELQHSGKLDNGFNSLPDVASYMAWFCPGAKSFFDQRLDLDAGSVADYMRAKQSLRQEAEYIIRVQSDPQTPPPGHDWQEVFRSRGVNYLVLNNMEGNPVAGVLAAKFLLDPLHWAPLYVDGRTMIFGWQPPEQPHAFRDVALNLGRRAFGPVPEDRRAPRQAPEWPQEPRDFWQHYWLGPPERPLAASEGRFYLIDYNMRSQQWLGLVSQSWRFDQWLGPVGMAGVIPGSVSGPATLATFISRQLLLQRGQNNRPVLLGADNGPPADPVLAVRAARRAVAASPDDAPAYLLLADAYHTLWENQEQRWVSRPARGPQAFLDLLRGNLLERQTIRQIQFTSALSEFAQLQPEQASPTAADIHWELAQNFLRLHYLDLALEQMRDAVAHLPAIPPSAAQKDQLSQKREVFERILKNVEADVKKRQEFFKLQTSGAKLHPLQGFEIALLKPYQTTDENNRKTLDRRGLGLARLALDLLRQANVATLTDMEKQIYLDWQLRLLLTIGRVGEVREILTPGLKPLLRARYDEFEVVLGAATGDYQRADQALAELEKQSVAFEKLFLNQQRSFLVLTLAFDPPTQMLPIVRASEFVLQQLMARNVVVSPVGQAEAELRTLRGLLALEQGDTAAAAAHLRAALQQARAGVLFPDRAIVERYLRLLNAP